MNDKISLDNRQRRYSETNRQKAKSIGRPEGRVYHVAYFEAVERELARLVESESEIERNVVRRIVTTALDEIVSEGYEPEQVKTKREAMLRNLGIEVP